MSRGLGSEADDVLDAALARMLAPTDAGTPPPGAVIGVQIGGRRSFRAVGDRLYGKRHEPMTEETKHDLASVTKVAATTAVIQKLVHDRRITLDTEVATLLPEAPLGVWRGVSVRDLLLHQAGLRPWWPLYFESSTREEAIALALGLPRSGEPRTQRVYSDLGFIALGAIVESVTGSRLDEAARTLVFDEVGVASLGFATAGPFDGYVSVSSLGDAAEYRMVESGIPYPVPFRATDFDRWRTDPIIGEPNDGNAFHALGSVSGHAGLFGTVGDLVTLAAALSSPARHGLWPDAMARSFERTGPDAEQAHGFRRRPLVVDGRSTSVFWHPGFTGTAIGYLPEFDAQIAFAANRLQVAHEPVATEVLWQHALEAVRTLLVSQQLDSQKAEHPCR